MADSAQDMKTRLRADLRNAMKDKSAEEAGLNRALIAAIDNTETPSLRADERAMDRHRFQEGSAEAERLSLTADRVRAVLEAELVERVRDAAEMHRLGQPDLADALHAEMLLVQRYIE